MDSHTVPIKHSWFSWVCSWLQSPLLLVIRLIWGILFILTGAEKLGDMTKVIEFFTSLDLPNPVFFAWLVALTETICGALLVVGLWTRLAAIPLITIMVVAYATDSREAVMNIFNNFREFMKQMPFEYLLATLIIFSFGPGCFSLDCIWSFSRGKDKPKKEETK